MDPERIPVIVGVGQTVNRPKTMEEIREPADLIEASIRRAAEDAGAEGAVAETDMLGVVNILSWSYEDPPARVAERIGAPLRRSFRFKARLPPDDRGPGGGAVTPGRCRADSATRPPAALPWCSTT